MEEQVRVEATLKLAPVASIITILIKHQMLRKSADKYSLPLILLSSSLGRRVVEMILGPPNLPRNANYSMRKIDGRWRFHFN